MSLLPSPVRSAEATARPNAADADGPLRTTEPGPGPPLAPPTAVTEAGVRAAAGDILAGGADEEFRDAVPAGVHQRHGGAEAVARLGGAGDLGGGLADADAAVGADSFGPPQTMLT